MNINAYAIPGITIKLKEVSRIKSGDKIIDKSLPYFDLARKQLLSRRRSTDLVKARFFIMFYLRSELNLRVTEIGLLFEKDHTSVIHGVKRISEELRIYSEVREDYENYVKFITR